MAINFSQHSGICVNEILIHGNPENCQQFIKTVSFPDNASYSVINDYYIIMMTETPFLDIIKNLEQLSINYKVNMENAFYNSEGDYAGTAYIFMGNTTMEIDTYYRGLYYNYPKKFWEEIDNLLNMMGESGGDWEEVEAVINFCQYEDYNFIKDKFKECITNSSKKN
jgi:hypothetical protein